MSKNVLGILCAIAFILFSAAMTGLHWLMTGINEDFGMGFVVGLILGFGILGLASRQVRETD